VRILTPPEQLIAAKRSGALNASALVVVNCLLHNGKCGLHSKQRPHLPVTPAASAPGLAPFTPTFGVKYRAYRIGLNDGYEGSSHHHRYGANGTTFLMDVFAEMGRGCGGILPTAAVSVIPGDLGTKLMDTMPIECSWSVGLGGQRPESP
jgi:hypothetical protein